jgi:hypothetical protein
LELTVNTVRGPIEFSSRGKLGSRDLALSLPAGCEGELVVDRRESLTLKPIVGSGSSRGFARYQLPMGEATSVHLKFS